MGTHIVGERRDAAGKFIGIALLPVADAFAAIAREPAAVYTEVFQAGRGRCVDRGTQTLGGEVIEEGEPVVEGCRRQDLLPVEGGHDVAANMAAQRVAAVIKVAVERSEQHTRQRQCLARLQMQRQTPKTGLQTNRPVGIRFARAARLRCQADTPQPRPFHEEGHALGALRIADDRAGQVPVGGAPALARLDGKGWIDLRRLQQLAVDEGKVMGRKVVGKEPHTVYAADPWLTESRLQRQLQVPGEAFSKILQGLSTPVCQHAPALDRASIGKKAHMPLDLSAFLGVRCQHRFGRVDARDAGHSPGIRGDAANAEGD